MPLDRVEPLGSEWKPMAKWRLCKGLEHNGHPRCAKETLVYSPAAFTGCACKPLPSKVKTLTSS